MHRVDLAILFALKEEFEAFFSQISKEHRIETDKKTRRSSFLFNWKEGDSAPYHCLTTFVGSMGAQDAALVTARILLSYSPANLVLVGIAGGLADHVLLGDVVVADEVRDYIQDGKVGDKGFSPSGRMYRTSGQTKNTLNFIDKTERHLWNKIRIQSESDVRKILKKHKVEVDTLPIRPKGLEIHVGHIASGPVVATSRRFAKWLIATDRKFTAVEMESAGFMNAVYEFGEDARAIVIRGISDNANTKKEALDKLGSGVLRKLAMTNALLVLKALVATNSLPRATEVEANEDGCRIVGAPDWATGLSHPASYGDIQREFREKVYAATAPALRRVRVFGFTYKVFWTMMRDMLADPGLSDWAFDLYCISPEFVHSNRSLLAEPWLADSPNEIKEMRAWFSRIDNTESLNQRRVKVRLRTYDLLPFLHGKLFADGTIFFHSAQWDKEERLAYPNTFHEIISGDATSVRAMAYRGLFGNWVNKYDRSVRETIFESADFDWSALESEMKNLIQNPQGRPDGR